MRDRVLEALSINPLDTDYLMIELDYQGEESVFERLLLNLKKQGLIRMLSDRKWCLRDSKTPPKKIKSVVNEKPEIAAITPKADVIDLPDKDDVIACLEDLRDVFSGKAEDLQRCIDYVAQR